MHPCTNSVLNTSKLFLLCLLIHYSIKIILLGWWKWSSKRTIAQPHSTCMNGFLPAHLKAAQITGILQALQNFTQLQRYIGTRACSWLQHFILNVSKIQVWCCLHCLMFYSTANKILIRVPSNVIQHHNKAEIVNGIFSSTVMGLQCSWQLSYIEVDPDCPNCFSLPCHESHALLFNASFVVLNKC